MNMESQKGMTLFDVILQVLEQVISEVKEGEGRSELSASLESMEVDQ